MSKYLTISRRPGFTLIELLVVISIIALLIAVLLPTLAASRNSARTLQCLSSIRQMSNLVAIYGNDNTGFMPAAQSVYDSNGNGTIDGGDAAVEGTQAGFWFEVLQIALEGTGSNLLYTEMANQKETNLFWSCPEWEDSERFTDVNFRTGYGFTRQPEATSTSGTGPQNVIASWAPDVEFWRPEDLEFPTKRAIIGDCADWGLIQQSAVAYQFGDTTQYALNQVDLYRHLAPVGGTNLAFADGHAESINQPQDASDAVRSPDLR
ncbi:MAG: type II secretion system protein [Planctomycetota bacterium]